MDGYVIQCLKDNKRKRYCGFRNKQACKFDAWKIRNFSSDNSYPFNEDAQ